MKIGILQTGHTPTEMADIAEDYAILFRTMLGEGNFEYQTWNVVDGDFPASVDAADGYIITGSRHGAYEDHPWIPPLEQLIRDIHAAKKPLFGACFGHQIIAQALGGRVEKSQNGWGVGLHHYDFDGKEMKLNAWHQDQVVDLPPEARVVASSPFCKYAALAWGDHIFTTQAHPEFQSVFIKGLIDYRGKGVVPANLLETAENHLAEENDNAQLAATVTRLMRGEGIA
ncbi:type 1 glutamine amidotransferase [Donghicola mangrovi]|uniref:Type 1 glutamine amidotransferase n=1 Tax=Donghicola mangrovi TaxID=2729614 RepID=A0A850QC21_9RHOB|nr:type 1 glutamine amidotransferase [Donghicola mangrovi]NVO23451.1 type 1 glutamine amidotransferase [Donghicola mangrovi]